jgi:hypothetical protein
MGSRTRTRIGRIGALATALPLAGGCYSFTAIPVEPAPVGENVRLFVTRTGSPELLSVSETNELVPQIRGRVEGSENGSLLVRMPLRGDQGGGSSVLDIAQLVRVPTDEILALELQRFSPARTSFLVAGGVAAAAFILYVIIDAGRDDTGIDDPDPDVLFGRIRIPIG